MRGIVIPAPREVDLDPVLRKLAALEAAAATRPVQPPSNPEVRAGSRNLLNRPAYGKPDDLN